MEKTIDGNTNPTTNFKRDFLNTRYYRVCAVKGLMLCWKSPFTGNFPSCKSDKILGILGDLEAFLKGNFTIKKMVEAILQGSLRK
jgi:hypothetical protein